MFCSVYGQKSIVSLLSEKEEADLHQNSSEETDPARPLLHTRSKSERSCIKGRPWKNTEGKRSHLRCLPPPPPPPPHSVRVSMDSHLWRDRQQQSEHQPPALALLEPEPSSSINKAAVAAGQTPLFTLPSVGYFTLAQWQELELQALIYKYMLAGVSVPVELILPVRRSLLSASPYFHYPELYHHFQPSLLQTSYWGKCGIDPEPGRCRRTDGKKWRCSREVVVGQKYCERHVHRGRNRSRKHVEVPTPSSISVLKTGLSTPSVLLAQENHLNVPRPLPTPNMHSLDRRQSGIQTVEKNLQGNCPNFYLDDLPDNKPEGYVLQRFLDEWPKSQRENDDSINYVIHPASTTHLSISVPGNHSSDFSLKLSTGNPEQTRENNNNELEMQQLAQPSNKGSGWVSHGEATMGGPLAEALRSSTSTHSPTSVLHKPNGSIYEISSISS